MASHLSMPSEIAEVASEISGPENHPPPPVSFSITIDPPTYSVRDDEVPNLCLSITSYAPRPITIYTGVGSLNPGRSLRNHRYEFFNLTTNQRVWMSTETSCRSGGPVLRRLGSYDEKDYLTLLPETVTTIVYPLYVVRGWNTRDPEKSLTWTPRAPRFNGEEFRMYFEPGHKYRFRIGGGKSAISWWRYGKKRRCFGTPWYAFVKM